MSEENTGTLSRIPSVEHVSSDASNHAGIKSIKKSARENNSTLYTTYSYDTNVIKKVTEDKVNEVKNINNINSIKFDGYYGPFNKKTNLTTFRKKKNLIASRDKET